MFVNNYTPKLALQDVLKFLGYRVHNPTAEVTAELLEAEARLRDLNTSELLDTFGAALRCGITPGIAPVVVTLTDDEPAAGNAGRFGRKVLSLNR